MILNKDGTPYSPKGCLQQYDPTSNKHDLLNRYDAEAIRIGGSPIYYYEVLIQSQTVDPLYLEDRGKLFNPNPILLYAFYEPPQQENMQGLFAIDVMTEEIVLELNYQEVLGLIGHPPKVGSKIYTPHRGEHWEILDIRLDKFNYWGVFRLIIQCKKFQNNSTSAEGYAHNLKPN
jgi:hypothetical protein